MTVLKKVAKPLSKGKPASFTAKAKSVKNNARGTFIQRAKLYGKG